MTEPFPESCGTLCKCYSNHQNHIFVGDCSDSKLQSFPPSLPGVLTWLLVTNNNISDLSKDVFNQFDIITYLNLSHNSITMIPHSIQNMKLMIRLDVSHNHIVIFPEAVTKIPPLAKLNLQDNQIKSIPISIQNMKLLTRLDLSYNCVKNIPSSIQKMISLTYLDMSHNQLKTIPSSIATLKSLTHLDVSHNNITSLPRSIETMQSLKYIKMSSNKFHCSCDITWLSYWISWKMAIIPDPWHTKCKDGFNKYNQIHMMNVTAMGCTKKEYNIPSWAIQCKSSFKNEM